MQKIVKPQSDVLWAAFEAVACPRKSRLLGKKTGMKNSDPMHPYRKKTDVLGHLLESWYAPPRRAATPNIAAKQFGPPGTTAGTVKTAQMKTAMSQQHR